jgi:hypothetical protein
VIPWSRWGFPQNYPSPPPPPPRILAFLGNQQVSQTKTTLFSRTSLEKCCGSQANALKKNSGEVSEIVVKCTMSQANSGRSQMQFSLGGNSSEAT